MLNSQRPSLWGQVFEIAVKRGVLTALLGSPLANTDDLKSLGLTPWQQLDLAHVYHQLAKELKETDDNLKTRSRETARHLFELGMGLGQTAMREYLNRLTHAEDYSIKALWCPLQLPKPSKVSREVFDTETETALREFFTAFGQDGQLDNALTGKGFPVRADFLLWLEPKHSEWHRELLCLEFSLNSPPETADYTQPEAHLAELRQFASFMESRSVFSRVCAEVSGEAFELSPHITQHLPAFTGRDKPFYKLCQAASYICTTLRWLKSKGFDDRPCNARALSITQNGFESLAATFFIKGETDSRENLMASLGRAYREIEKTPDCDEDALNNHIRFAFKKIRQSLPLILRQQLTKLAEFPSHDGNVAFNISENLEDFFNPMAKIPLPEALSWIDVNADLTDFLKDPKSAIAKALTPRVDVNQKMTLRDLHAAAVIAGMQASTLGKITVLGLEGNPGIGKTTAVMDVLKKAKKGFLFLYVSPRVIINDDVSGSFAKSENGTLTLTTNSKLISTAKTYHEKQVQAGILIKQFIDSAVVVDGIPINELKFSASSTLLVTPAQKEQLEQIHVGSNYKKHAETERQDRMENTPQATVFSVLAKTTRTLLADNPNLNKLVLTAAIQGYRELSSDKTTINALDDLFKNPVNRPTGKQERQQFAERIQTIVVMVDELTGDGAGAPMIHALTKWLTQQFIKPFENQPLFRVILIISDASLGNEIVLNTYLNSGDRAPDKVLVAKSQGKRPFRLAVTPIKLGGKQLPVLHIMTNSYPASTLAIDYRVRLDAVKPVQRPDGKMQTLRQAIAEQQDEATLNNIIQEIRTALDSGAEQIIFFAQNKLLLRSIEDKLITLKLVAQAQIAILDSSVLSTKRKALIERKRRDSIKIFLMTSSAARGVSFPKTDTIIALIPRFNIEAALMEIAQLIYRGRGKNYTADNGTIQEDGDWKNRRLVMLLQDFLPVNDVLEPRQWLRQVSDLLTYLVMLRATIYTRITGDAGLDKQQLALIPVGGIGSEEMVSLMSTSVRDFLQEADVLLYDRSTTKEQQGLVMDARSLVLELFSKFSLEGTATLANMSSVTQLKDRQRFSELASADNAPLLLPKDTPNSLLPKHLYCVGAFWLENWQDMDKQERFNIEGWLADMADQSSKLLAELRFIYENQDLPYKLRRPAEELYTILARKKAELTREFSTVKTLKSKSTWLAVPIDYARFWKKNADDEKPSLGDESAWRDYLGACLSSRAVLPVIPRYADIPFVVSIGEQDPMRLNLVFDNRYLGVSNELNLLNTLLLNESQ
jgi:hypothetical protein